MTPGLRGAVATMNRCELMVLAVLRQAPAAMTDVALLARLASMDPTRWARPDAGMMMLGTTLSALTRKLDGSGLALYREGHAWALGAELPPGPSPPAIEDPEPTIGPGAATWRALRGGRAMASA